MATTLVGTLLHEPLLYHFFSFYHESHRRSELTTFDRVSFLKALSAIDIQTKKDQSYNYHNFSADQVLAILFVHVYTGACPCVGGMQFE